ncbi:MAG: HAD family hydrolase [Pseudomonadota bacterium]
MTKTTPIRIAMWSGPRNLSTTMMRSFGIRADTACIDEPFYAPFLAATGLDHPMASQILQQCPDDPETVDALLSTRPASAPIQYQKHMTHHMLPAFPTRFMGACRHAFLIRRPERVLASYQRKMETLSLEAIGLPHQVAMFERAIATTGKRPPVIDSDDLLAAPESMLRALCQALDIGWDPAMLSWPAGPRFEDGPWAPHWYDTVWRSTGFGPPPGPLPHLSGPAAQIAADARPLYNQLAAHKLQPS